MMTNNALQLSVEQLQKGEFDQAEETLRGLLRDEGGNVQGWCLLGRIRQARGRPDEALPLFQQAVQLDPHNADGYSLAGSALIQLGQAAQAQTCLEEALRLNPFHPEAYNNLGKVHLLNQRGDEALACFREAVRLQPNNFEILNNLALMLIGRRQFDEARPLLEQIVQMVPNFAAGHLSLSALYFEQGELDKALAAAQSAMQLDPHQAAAYAQLGAVLLKMDRHKEAIAPLQAALRIAPRQVQALEHLGLAFKGEGRLEEAENHLRGAAQLDPNNTRVLGNLTGILSDRRNWEELIAVASQAVQMGLVSHDLLHNLGVAYSKLKRPQEASTVLEQAIQLRPSAASCVTLGWAYMADSQFEQARASFSRALELEADSPAALAGLAAAYRDLGLVPEALDTYRRSLAVEPHQPDTHSALVYNLHFGSTPTPEEIFQEHLEWARRQAVPPNGIRSHHPNNPDPNRRLRLGYVSADLAWHVMGHYVELILEAHDPSQFEIFCYANVGHPDDKTQRLRQLAHHWRNVYDVHDDQMEQMVLEDGIEVLVDLNGHTANNRLRLFARKPAPVQVSHFGYMATTGVPAIDYRLTDAVCDPPGMTERYHTEQLVRLPDIAWCYRPNTTLEVNPLPAASSGGLTLGMLNHFSKITPPAIAAWSRILSRLPGSRLLILANSNSAAAQERLLRAFGAHGIDARRLAFLGRRSMADYFRIYHQLDFMLDPFPYTGCNTTCDALWMGVPVVTLAGKLSLARQGASPLAHLGLHDLIAERVEDYVETAVRLGTDLVRLSELRATLRERMRSSTLMNPQRFTRQLEGAYRWMWQQWCNSRNEPG